MSKKIIKSLKNIQKYRLWGKDIIELDDNSIIRQKLKEYFSGLAEQAVDWPVEIQGSGKSISKEKRFAVYYPVGDIFLSSAVTFHELGHLRQEEDKNFTAKELGLPGRKISRGIRRHDKSELYAWRRGFSRAEKYCPEYLKLLNTKFRRYKKQGGFKRFADFKDFYKYVVKVSLKITDFYDKLASNKALSDRERGRVMGKMIKKDRLTGNFFTCQELWRSGEKVDIKIFRKVIKKIARKVAEEKY